MTDDQFQAACELIRAEVRGLMIRRIPDVERILDGSGYGHPMAVIAGCTAAMAELIHVSDTTGAYRDEIRAAVSHQLQICLEDLDADRSQTGRNGSVTD